MGFFEDLRVVAERKEAERRESARKAAAQHEVPPEEVKRQQEEVISHMATLMHDMTFLLAPVKEAVIGHRNEYVSQGFPPEVAAAMAGEYHKFLIGTVLKSLYVEDPS